MMTYLDDDEEPFCDCHRCEHCMTMKELIRRASGLTKCTKCKKRRKCRPWIQTGLSIYMCDECGRAALKERQERRERWENTPG
jgi:hypothetical protein